MNVPDADVPDADGLSADGLGANIAGAAVEVNFDGLIGPTHNFAGLAPGNLASLQHKSETSNPRAAALQGLQKMQRLRSLGIPQAILPPQQRPNLKLLRRLGFRGDDAGVVKQAQQQSPHLLAAAMSGSSMWTANAATVSPAADSADGRIHFTPANLAASLHRATETPMTAQILRRVFGDENQFVHHEWLPGSADLGDEGAANHTRFCSEFNDQGVQLFVFGMQRGANADTTPKRYAARQSRDASEAVARLHQLRPDRVVFARQHPAAIDAGVFHNDVIAVGHRRLLFYHETAFDDDSRVVQQLRMASGDSIRFVKVPENRLSLDQAVATYLFNSQIVTSGDDRTILVAPDQCREHYQVKVLLKELVDDGTFDSVEFVDVGQSMNNGGGPACLRLRVVMTPAQFAATASGVFLTNRLHDQLTAWINRHYRDSLDGSELADPMLIRESYDALDELTGILGLGAIYEFQKSG
ncbi:MAG: N-succinylarginine dihydrolase [Planctomycetales bacterium]|nr:N-succinylarginine dihydrolase [Planctomycetales bacterium]